MSYKKEFAKKFHQKGYWNPHKKVFISTKRDYEGQEFDIYEALDYIGAGGVEIDVKIEFKDSEESVTAPKEEG